MPKKIEMIQTSKKIGPWSVTLKMYADAGGEILLARPWDDEMKEICKEGNFSATAYFMFADNARAEYWALENRDDIGVLLTRML